MFKNGRRFKLWFAIGAVILVVGFVLQWYPASVVGGLEERMSESDLSLDEFSKLEGARNSWRVWQITTFQPVSNVLIAVGIILLVYSVTHRIFSIVSSYKMTRKAD